jgi:beta-phosphoglucomutase
MSSSRGSASGGPATLGALVFDMDGTLADSDPVHLLAFRELLAAHGIPMDEETYRRRLSGRTNEAIFAELFPHHPESERGRLADEKEAIFRRRAPELAPLAGLPELLDWAESRSLPLGLVTNAPAENVTHTLEALGIASRFAVRVLGSEVARPKPDPLPYLTALDRLGVPPGQAIAFEDSLAGVRSARAAGIFTVGVLTGQSASDLRAAGADLPVRDFADPALWAILAERAG